MGDGGQYSSYVYDGATTYVCNAGGVTVVCVGDTMLSGVKYPLYDVTVDYVTTTGAYLYMHERVPGLIVDMQYYSEFSKDPSVHANDWYALPQDQPMNATNILLDTEVELAIAGEEGAQYYTLEAYGEQGANGVYAELLMDYPVGTICTNDVTMDAILQVNGQKTSFTSAFGHISQDANGVIFADLYFATAAGYYHLEVQEGGSGEIVVDPANYANDANSDFSASFTNAIWDTNYFASTGIVYLDADGDMMDQTKAISLAFVPANVGKNPVIPTGVYPINLSFTTGTVAASQGYDGQNIYQSYAYTSTDGININSAWFIVSGTVTVSTGFNGTMNIAVSGKNYLGKNVNVNIVADATPINNVEAEVNAAAKRIDANGQLIINRNGVDYNVLGF